MRNILLDESGYFTRLQAESGMGQRYFLGLFKRKKAMPKVRPGALLPEEVKKQIEEIGIGKQIQIIRVGFDGSIDDMPIIIELIDIDEEGFTGRVVNPERQVIESATKSVVYAKHGGGIISFRYDDGDIKEILLSQDETILQEERDVNSLKEILAALDVGDQVLVAYYDPAEKGTLNAEGKILEKASENVFKLSIEKINHIELENKITKQFDVEKDLVIDIELI